VIEKRETVIRSDSESKNLPKDTNSKVDQIDAPKIAASKESETVNVDHA
jgi:hypothetical protein